jgi:hypothetical protein
MDDDDSSSLLLPSPTTIGDDDDDAAVKPRKVTRRRRAMDDDDSSLFVIISASFSVSSLMEAMTECCRDVDGPRVREGTATRKDSTTSYITVTMTKLMS